MYCNTDTVVTAWTINNRGVFLQNTNNGRKLEYSKCSFSELLLFCTRPISCYAPPGGYVETDWTLVMIIYIVLFLLYFRFGVFERTYHVKNIACWLLSFSSVECNEGFFQMESNHRLKKYFLSMLHWTGGIEPVALWFNVPALYHWAIGIARSIENYYPYTQPRISNPLIMVLSVSIGWSQ